MKDIPIIFSAPMVRALIDGRKTMTRRLATSRRKRKRVVQNDLTQGQAETISEIVVAPSSWTKARPGDRLWVKETWLAAAEGCWSVSDVMRLRGIVKMDLRYRADGLEGPWYPSIHMPRWASRLTLVVTAVKVEPLQKISDEDARLEGAGARLVDEMPHLDNDFQVGGRRGLFMGLWAHLHGMDSLHANPDVVALTFQVHHCNIDQVKEAA